MRDRMKDETVPRTTTKNKLRTTLKVHTGARARNRQCMGLSKVPALLKASILSKGSWQNHTVIVPFFKSTYQEGAGGQRGEGVRLTACTFAEYSQRICRFPGDCERSEAQDVLL